MATTLIEKGNPGYSKQQMQMRNASAVPATPVTPAQTSNMPVSADSAARGVVGYGAGGATQYGASGAAKETYNANRGENVYGFSDGSYNVKPVTTASPITISNKNKDNQVSEMNNTLAGYSANRGMTSDGETMRYPDGSVYQEPKKVNESDIESAYKSSPEFQLLEQMRQSLDANTASQIAGIQQQLEQRRMETNEFSQNQSRAAERSRLMSGQAQAAPTSVGSLMNAQEKYRVKQIAALDTEEQRLISAAKEAQQSGDYQLLAKQIGIIQSIREQKQKEVAEVNKTIAAQNKKLQEQSIQVSRDNALADLVEQGVTSPTELLKALNETGGDFTLKEVKDGLSNLIPDGLQDMAENARNNGASADKIAKAMQEAMRTGDVNAAYKLLGNDAAKSGTGIVAEYNFYKRDAESRGLVPVDFNTYQNQDANRKKSIAKAGSSGGSVLTPYQQFQATQSLSKDLQTRTKDAREIIRQATIIDTAYNNIKNKGDKSLNTQAMITAFNKILDPTSVVRESEYDRTAAGQSLIARLEGKIQNISAGGAGVTESTLKEAADLAKQYITGYSKSVQEENERAKQIASQFGINPMFVSSVSAQESTADALINKAAGAEQKLIEAGTANPALNDVIYKKMSTVDPVLKRKMNHEEVLQYLQATGQI